MRGRLKPCPFCGSSELELHTDAGIVYITCKCGICTTDFGGHDDLETDIKMAIETWNTRPYQKEFDRLNEEADWLAEVICKKHSDIRRNGFVPDCPIDRNCNNQCVQCWRQAARKAVEKENETHESQTDEAQER